jgi:EAL domain-containing protein (putative c-di-GMP-specific phosphodiesterase class I)
VYQPVVAIADGTVVAAEALLRWHHGKWGAVSPAAYMEDVAASDMLAEVTRFVLRTVSADMNAHPSARPLRVAVNIAPRDLERGEFVEEVIATVKCLPPNVSLVLELTELLLLSENVRTHATFTALKSDGVKFAIADFGTEHSNLDLLGRFPFDYVKIDRQFVTQLDAGGDDLISGVVALARHLVQTVIAEGVETQAQHDGLMAAGVPYAQGYLYQRPVAPQTLAALVRPLARQANP